MSTSERSALVAICAAALDADHQSALAQRRRGLRRERICALLERHRRRGHGHERADAAAGEDAQPRRIRERLAVAGAELRKSPARSFKEELWENSRWER